MRRKFTALFTTIASWTPRLSISLLLWGYLVQSVEALIVKKVDIINLIVREEQVVLRVKVIGEGDRPVFNLQDTNFSLVVDQKPLPLNSQNWKNPQQTTPPPAWVIFLLDYSGSMNQKDQAGTTKLQGALQAIKEFIDASSIRSGNTQVAIIPFGETSDTCEKGFVNNQPFDIFASSPPLEPIVYSSPTITPNAIDQFSRVQDPYLQQYLLDLGKFTPCASTNIYTPVEQAIRLFANSSDERFYPLEKSLQPPPRLTIILLSDGYHNQNNEAEDFKNLQLLIERNPNITIHTLGYGLTPEQLGKKYKLGRKAIRRDVTRGGIPAKEFVDKERLEQIATLSGGISEFSGNARAIADSLKLFLDSLLGEYEISYTQPESQRGSKHDVQVIVSSSGKQTVSDTEGYTITVFGRSLPSPIRIIIIISALFLLIIGGIVPFYLWGKRLREENLH